MRTRPQLQAELAEARAKLAALPPAHEYRHPSQGLARRTALQARINGLEKQISTTPVHDRLITVEETQAIVDAEAPGIARELPDEGTVHSRAQADPQPLMPPDLQ